MKAKKHQNDLKLDLPSEALSSSNKKKVVNTEMRCRWCGVNLGIGTNCKPGVNEDVNDLTAFRLTDYYLWRL